MSQRDDRHKAGRLTEDEAMSGGIVWVCEHGHVDVAHKTEGNHLNLCSRCKDGVCEPKKTLGRRSKAQRKQDRELDLEPSRRKGEGRREEAPLTIRRPGQDPVVVAVENLRSDPTPAFDLLPEHRAAILAGKTPRIALPRGQETAPPGPGDVVNVAPNVLLIVRGHRVLVDELVLQYEVRDSRAAAGGDEGRIATLKAAEKPQERMGGPEFRAEREPERLPRREVAKIADRVHEAELRKLRRTREDLGRHLQEQASAPRDIRFHLGKTIEGIDRRIENIEGEMGQAA